MTHRSRRLTDLAHELPCTFTDLPHICTWPQVNCVPCHANWQVLGRGFAFKSDDNMFAAGCPVAHDLVDGRTPGLYGEDAFWARMRAHVRTMREIFERGLVVLR